MTWDGFVKKQSCLTHVLSMHLSGGDGKEKPRKRQDYQCPGQTSKLAPQNLKSEALPIEQPAVSHTLENNSENEVQ
jgi:hypothetical protein